MNPWPTLAWAGRRSIGSRTMTPTSKAFPAPAPISGSIRGWLPGTHHTDSSLQLPTELAPGRYEVAVGVVDSREGGPAVRLANAGRDAEGWYRVSELEIVP